MKRILIIVVMLIGFSSVGQDYQKTKFQVWGNCEMCQTKIIKAAKAVDGVRKAHWNIASQQMMVKFDVTKTSLEAIQKVIAEIGYDTELYRATKEDYEQLHYCCKYDRPEPLKNDE